ncbi:MAG TPA: sugar phosphate isomerase/epimerase family protein [Anaerolineae bacterium]|nr:sugar phosphate isomerase/epimerase family protein [Anaerolineae bacterium]
MKIGVFGWIISDLTDVDSAKIRGALDLGFTGLGAHVTVPASRIADETIEQFRAAMAGLPVDFLQLWGPYPCIIAPDEDTRRAGVAQAREIVRLAARLGAPMAGVRPTSLNPRYEWAAHPDNYTPETEERFYRSLMEILETAHEAGVGIVLETHQTTVLDSPQRIRRIIERTGSDRVRVNIDPANFVTDFRTAFNPAPMIHELFDVLGPYADTVHVKDIYLEDRFLVHINESVIGTGIMDLDTVLRRSQEILPDGYVVVEHLPVNLIPLAKRNLDRKIKELGIPVG